jgi:SAM-dependent methyltransferase
VKTVSTASVKRAAGTAMRQVLHSTYDTLDRQQRAVDPLVPPRQLNPNIGFIPRRAAYAKDFVASGNRIVEMLVAYGQLTPEQSVLDVGSGIGRVARALTSYLSPAGEYKGFDVDPRAVAWCQRAYKPHRNVAFVHAPIGYVNVKGNAPVRGEDYVFPYADESVDLAFSISVYTHLGIAIVDNYLAETSRVLRRGGVCVNTFFVIDDVAVAAMREGRADRTYVDQGDGTFLQDPLNPNLGIGFAPSAIE